MPEVTNLHIPVLLEPILNLVKQLDVNKQEYNLKVFDGTFGGGGYSTAFLDIGCEVYASDLDSTAISEFNGKNNPNLHLEQANFAQYIQTFPKEFFDLIVLDLGFSSNQLSFSQRGFSYQNLNETFDLRYNNQAGKSVVEKIIKLEKALDLQYILYRYSGEMLSKPIAESLFYFTKNNQRNNPILVQEVVEVITKAIPRKFQAKQNAILSRVWQALRIWTNDEFGALEQFLSVSLNKLKIGGLLAIVDFHSLEDKIVTKFMREASNPLEIDEYGNKQRQFKFLTPKGIEPTEQETKQNVRSRSAKLRVLKKLPFANNL